MEGLEKIGWYDTPGKYLEGDINGEHPE